MFLVCLLCRIRSLLYLEYSILKWCIVIGLLHAMHFSWTVLARISWCVNLVCPIQGMVIVTIFFSVLRCFGDVFFYVSFLYCCCSIRCPMSVYLLCFISSMKSCFGICIFFIGFAALLVYLFVCSFVFWNFSMWCNPDEIERFLFFPFVLCLHFCCCTVGVTVTWFWINWIADIVSGCIA